ncbi:CSEP0040 putative effector protein [Golovinomyces cichoracearum]|uniref:CSEP0040 putative effector protein n=1 Tax=Golovinomyces cichoracearum TaxID=62708 RepID=A0A420IFL5_9PEZI|nr:CSEP0040 putative effector protein [Golovinomyces cichoracearum]
MRISLFTVFGLCLAAAAYPEYARRDDQPETNTTMSGSASYTMTMSSMTMISSGIAIGTGVETATAITTGVHNNSTFSSTGYASSPTSMAHKPSSSSMPESKTSSAGAAPTGVWENNNVKGAMAGAIGVLGLALAL